MRRLGDPSQGRIGIKTVPWGLGRFGGGYFRKVLSTEPNNLIGYWPLWETQGLIAENIQGIAARNGTYSSDVSTRPVGPGIGDGRTAPQFDGTNDFVDIFSASLDAVFNGSEGTLALWGKVRNVGVWTDGVLRRTSVLEVDANNKIIFSKTAANLLQTFYEAGNIAESQTTPTVAVEFFHQAISWSATTDEVRHYFNGVQQGITDVGLGVWAGNFNPASVVIGADNTGPANVWDGFIAHVAVWDTPLTPAQFADLATI